MATKFYIGMVVFMGYGFVQILVSIKESMPGLVG
jgi:hypothetical protein